MGNLERNGTMARPIIRFVGDTHMEIGMDALGDVTNFTMATLRELVFKTRVLSLQLHPNMQPSRNECDVICDMCLSAVTSGQVIDCGHLPNSIFMDASVARAGNLYKQKALGHPFRTPWMFMHSWSDPTYDSEFMRKVTGGTTPKMFAAYLVSPFMGDEKSPVGVDFEVCSLDPMTVAGNPVLMIGDRIVYYAEMSKEAKAYGCLCVPSQFRILAEENEDVAKLTNRGMDTMNAASANCMDPILTVLLMLNTRGIKNDVVTVSDKLNKARVKSGKRPIPPYRKLETAEYVSILLARKHRGEHKGGTHSSPIPHLRIGHWRNYITGERSFINDTLVRVTPEMREAFKASRMGYQVKE